MSIMDIFRSGTKTTSVTQEGAPNNQQPTIASQTSSVESTSEKQLSNVDPNNNSGDSSQSPLGKFDTLWDTPKTEGEEQPSNMFNVDMTKLMETAKKVDFSRNLNPEVLKKIAAGGEESIQAFQQAMNDMSQQVYAQSAYASTKITEQAIKQAEERFAAQLPAYLKKHQLSDSLLIDNPALNSKAAAPIVDAMQRQMAVKFPNATSAELKEMATQYLKAFADTVTKKPEAKKESSKDEFDGFDFSHF